MSQNMELDEAAVVKAAEHHDNWTRDSNTIGSRNAIRNTRQIIEAYLAAAPTPSPQTGPATEGEVVLDLATLKWWRELVDLNPADLAPRLDDRIRALSLKETAP